MEKSVKHEYVTQNQMNHKNKTSVCLNYVFRVNKDPIFFNGHWTPQRSNQRQIIVACDPLFLGKGTALSAIFWRSPYPIHLHLPLPTPTPPALPSGRPLGLPFFLSLLGYVLLGRLFFVQTHGAFGMECAECSGDSLIYLCVWYDLGFIWEQ